MDVVHPTKEELDATVRDLMAAFGWSKEAAEEAAPFCLGVHDAVLPDDEVSKRYYGWTDADARPPRTRREE